MKISKEWKQEVSIENYKTYISQVNLFDFLFYYEEGKIFPRTNYTKNKLFPLEIDHKIIVFNTNNFIYDKYYQLKNTENEEEIIEQNRSKFALAIPKFDLRSMPLFLNDTASKSNLQTYTSTSSSDFQRFLEICKPQLLEIGDYFARLQTNNATYSPGIKIWDKESIKNFETTEAFDINSPNKLITFDIDTNFNPSLLEDKDIDFFLCKEDLPFSQKYLSGNQHLKAYNKIVFNYKSKTFWEYFCNYFNFQIINPDFSIFVGQEDTSGSVTMKDVTEYLLKHCWLLFRCAHFADYVDYRDFNQNLSQSAKVIHNNLILSSKGDYNRYDKIDDNIPDESKVTRPYIPTTTPSIDSHAREYFKNAGNADLATKMQILIDDGNNPDSNIGSLQTETFEEIKEDKSERFTSSESSASVPLWFDPESRKTADQYGDIPTIFMKDGNLITDGRIISRTIDELWEMIKKLVGGRKSSKDAQTDKSLGYPYGTGQLSTSCDTRPTIKSHTFLSNGQTFVGDPTFISYEDGDFLTFRVEEWINNPDKIHYSLMKELDDLSKKDYTSATLDKLSDLLFLLENIPEEDTPENQPYSLRELEGLLKGLKYNLAIFINYSNQNFVRVGKLGKEQGGEAWNKSAGSLYQLHKDFENKSNVNTIYNGENLGVITSNMIPHNDQTKVPSYAVYLAADGQYHSVSQAINIQIRNEEEF
ncbi:MAG: hypothetical protein IKK93_00370 [Campylobacter sp.]|nr:hypothetical protein [Campylobacter sp.]